MLRYRRRSRSKVERRKGAWIRFPRRGADIRDGPHLEIKQNLNAHEDSAWSGSCTIPFVQRATTSHMHFAGHEPARHIVSCPVHHNRDRMPPIPCFEKLESAAVEALFSMKNEWIADPFLNLFDDWCHTCEKLYILKIVHGSDCHWYYQASSKCCTRHDCNNRSCFPSLMKNQHSAWLFVKYLFYEYFQYFIPKKRRISRHKCFFRKS